MTDRLHLTAIGVPITVRFENAGATDLEGLRAAWARCSRTEPASNAIELTASLGAAGAPGGLAAGNADELADRLSARVTVEAIGARRDDLLMLHAAAVADPATGAVIALIGPSGRGKTTACSVLGRSFGYVTDETVGVTDDLGVVTYPKPLSVIEPPGPWKRQRSPDELGLLETGRAALHLVAVLLLDRDAGHPGAPAIEPVDLPSAIDELVPQVSYLPARGQPLGRLRWVLEQCGGLRRVRYAEAETLVPLVRDLLARERPSSGGFRAGPKPRSAAPGGPGTVVRAPIDDWIEDGEQLVVLRDGVVRVLGGIAPAIWAAASTPVDRAGLVAAVVGRHGHPEGADATAIVETAVRELLDAGMLLAGVDPESGAA